ncbi:hypothetical protein Tco_0043618, partial [Tanacetum coccineum]
AEVEWQRLLPQLVVEDGGGDERMTMRGWDGVAAAAIAGFSPEKRGGAGFRWWPPET